MIRIAEGPKLPSSVGDSTPNVTDDWAGLLRIFPVSSNLSLKEPISGGAAPRFASIFILKIEGLLH